MKSFIVGSFRRRRAVTRREAINACLFGDAPHASVDHVT